MLVANIEASDGGKAIVAGNERVIAARLSDAHYFYDTDRKPLPDVTPAMQEAAKRLSLDLTKPLDQRMAKLAATNVIFHEKLGTQGERVERIVRLAKEIAPLVGADPEKAGRAASLAKADLVTEMVGEFPELQGLMGRYYALTQGEDASVAAAIEDHYKPLGPSDRVPTDPVAIAVALADKLDTLVGFWAIDEKPTGSKDPYALRRAALGMIQIVMENGLRAPIAKVLASALQRELMGQLTQRVEGNLFILEYTLIFRGRPIRSDTFRQQEKPYGFDQEMAFISSARQSLSSKLIEFFHDRLKVQLREQGARHDLVDAVLALGAVNPPLEGEGRAEGAGWGDREKKDSTPSRRAAPGDLPPPGGGGPSHRPQGVQDDLVLIVRRVEALGSFLDTDDGANLLAGYKRATNIVREEEKKSGEAYDGDVDPAVLSEPEERALFEAIGAAEGEVRAAVEVEDFADAMRALAKLRAPVDAFFDKVLVNAPEPDVRANRLRLLNKIRQVTLAVADFSRIGG